MTRWLERLVLVCPAALAALLALRPLGNFDIGYHIRAGGILAAGPWPKVDPFSYASEPWVLEQWLGSIAFYLLDAWRGAWGVIVGEAALVFGVFVLAVVAARLACGSAPAAALAGILGAEVAWVRFSARPYNFSFLFLSLMLVILVGLRRRNFPPRVFLLVPLFALWPHFHPEYLTALSVLAAFAAGAGVEVVLRGRSERVDARVDLRGFARLLLAGLACAAVVPASLLAFHPTGLASLRRVLELSGSEFFRIHTNEVRPLWTNYGITVPTALLLFGPPAAWLLWRRRIVPAYVFAHLLMTVTTLRVGRMIAEAAIVAVPVWAQAFRVAWESLPVVRWLPVRAGGVTVSLGAILVLSGALAGSAVHHGFGRNLDWNEEFYPRRCYGLIDAHEPQGNVFNDMYFGASFIYHFYPRRKLFVDGRSSYGESFFLQQYYPVMEAHPGWESIVDRWNVQWFLLRPGRHPELQHALKGHERWNFVYADDECVIFNRRTRPRGQ